MDLVNGAHPHPLFKPKGPSLCFYLTLQRLTQPSVYSMILTYIFLVAVWVNFFGLSLVSSQKTVKIDDGNVYSPANPNGIQFSPSGWSTVNPEGVDLRYGSSYTWSDTIGSNLVFFFRGVYLRNSIVIVANNLV